MENLIKIPLVLFIFFITFTGISQSKRTASDERMPIGKYIVKSSFRLPNMTSNVFMKDNSQGVADVSLSFNYNFYKRFYVGLGYRYTNFQISDKKLQSSLDSLLKSDIHQYGVYAELSYIFRLGESFSLETSIKAGQNNIFTTSQPCTQNGISGVSNKGVFYSPNIILYLRGEENLSFNVNLGFTITNSNFTPNDVCKPGFKDYSQSDYKDSYQFFSAGFGIVYSI